LKSKSQEPVARREQSPKKKPEPQSPPRKRFYKNTEGSLEVSFPENIESLTHNRETHSPILIMDLLKEEDMLKRKFKLGLSLLQLQSQKLAVLLRTVK